jgi:chromosome segregation ATPase
LVITEKPEAAQQILADLSANKKGRASIAALSLGNTDTQVPDAASGPHPTALSVVEADATVQPLLQRLLGRTLIVSDLTAATSAWQESRGAYDFVTLSGEVLSRHGIYTGGSTNGAGAAAGGRGEPAQGRAVERADFVAGGLAAGANGIARAGSGRRDA